MLLPEQPALILAPMDGVTDAPMRALQGATGAFTYAVSEFVRVSSSVPPQKIFLREVPELQNETLTPTGMPVQVQILGGDAGRMAKAALVACKAGARAIDINFGCPAPTVNRNDGGATLLKYPDRIREIVTAVRDAVPQQIPVSAKLRLGWDSIEAIFVNAEMAALGGANWITIHARTRLQGYAPPVNWKYIGKVREMLSVPVVANGDIWSVDDFRRCRDETGCQHFMIGRGALANPLLSRQIAHELGIIQQGRHSEADLEIVDWKALMCSLVEWSECCRGTSPLKTVARLKQWLKIAMIYGEFKGFEQIKQATELSEFFDCLERIIHDNDPDVSLPGKH